MSIHANYLQIVTARKPLLSRDEEREIDDTVSDLRLEKIAEAERQQKLGAGLVNVIREMPAMPLSNEWAQDSLLASKRFRRDMRGVTVGPTESTNEVESQREVLAEVLAASVTTLRRQDGRVAELEDACKKLCDVVLKERASKRRQLLWSIVFIVAAGLIGIAVGYVAGWLS